MENKKNKYGFIVLVEVLVVLLFILKLHNNLDECRAIDDAHTIGLYLIILVSQISQK